MSRIFGSAAVKAVAVVGCAFLPDLLVLPPGTDVAGAPAYLLSKTMAVVAMTALMLAGGTPPRSSRTVRSADDPRTIGPYVLRRCLGEGGMGSVYLAEHALLGRPCAIKLINAEYANDPIALARFEREVQTVAALTHPNTVQVYDYGRGDDGTLYYAMEYLPGVTLDELVTQHGPLDPARVVHILRRLCGALHEAHGRGLVHRDLKPANVMLCERGGVPDYVKLLDFGIVAALETGPGEGRLTQAGMIVGTPGFMSPEQCAGDGRVSPASDIYSIGALGYYLLTGSSPFGRRSTVQIVIAQMSEDPPPVTAARHDVPEALADVLAQCLKREPDARFADALALDHALADALGSVRWTPRDARRWWQERAGAA